MLDKEEGTVVSRGLAWLWLPSAILFLYLPLGVLVGAAKLDWGAPAYGTGAGAGLLTHFFVLALVLCPAMTWPLANGAERVWIGKPAKTFVVVLLLSAPLVSLGYYWGHVRGSFQVLDLALTLVPAAAIGVLQFARVQSWAGFVFTLALTAFVPLFVIGDLLGPMTTLWTYSSQGPAIYYYRATFAACAVFAAFLANPRNRLGFDEIHSNHWRIPIAIAACVLFLHFVAGALYPAAGLYGQLRPFVEVLLLGLCFLLWGAGRARSWRYLRKQA